MDMILREMQADEAKKIQKLGEITFMRSLEGAFVSKPKTARVAVKDGNIVGGLIYKIEQAGRKKLGFIDFFFVDPKYAGKGIGNELCKDAIAHMWAEGCDCLAVIVRDDNVGSWLAFEKNGFVRADLFKVAGELGVLGFVKTYLKHWYGFCPGCELFYVSRDKKEAELPDYAKKAGFGQAVLHVFTNIALMLVLILSSVGFTYFAGDIVPQLPDILIPLLIIFGGSAVFGFIGTLFSKHDWGYRMTTGGLLMSAGASIFSGFIPMMGNWYPRKYENTPEFRRDMGITAVLPWLFVMGLAVLMVFFGEMVGFLGGNQATIIVLLVFRCMPFPMISFGSVRIFRWSKIIYGVMFASTIALIVSFLLV